MPQDLTDQPTVQGETGYGEPAFAPAMLAALADHGPLAVPELAAELGVTEPELFDELAARADVTETIDGWCSVWVLAEAAVLTHLISEDELERGMLAADGDLDLWARLADQGLPLATGGELRACYRSGPLHLPPGAVTALTGPPGWLSACAPDSLVGLRLTGGAIALESYTPVPPPPDGTVQRLVTIAARLADLALAEEDEDGLGVPLDEVVLEALLREPTLLREPLPPLSALVVMVGLQLSHGYVALPGADWHSPRRRGGLSRDQRRTLAHWRGTLRRVAQQWSEPVEPGSLQPLLQGLAADPDLLGALALDVAHQDLLTPSLAHLAAAAEGGQQRAAAAYLLAVEADAVGDLQDAQDRLDEALTDNSDLDPAVLMAAEFAAERGDAFVADRLYRQAGEDISSPWRSLLREFLKAPEGKVGRNRPCPCGSGRKFKQCCGRQQPHPLPRRALWRYRRALAFAMRPARQKLLSDLAGTVAGRSGDFAEALVDPVVADLALVEGGLLGEYLEQRGALMPPDEAELVKQWTATPLALLEVVATRPGRELTLRKLPDGEPLVVRDRLMSSDVKPLEMLLGRLLYDGQDQVFLSQPRRVPRERRQALLALLAGEGVDPFTVAAALAPAGPPQMVTREGEQVVLCTARYAVPASMESAWAALTAELEEDDDGDLMETADVDGDTIIRGRLRQVSGGLEIETNALERLRRLQQRVLIAAPDARLVSESSIPAEKLSAAVDGGGLPASRLPPEVEQELLESLGEQAEQRWLDAHIPALGGLTPRAAAADPVARAELEALLDDFAWREQQSDRPAMLQAARLRDALGLPPHSQ